ncbi:Chromate resistance protein ChrB [Prauserella muralis]|uniref:Chromate resistance protein n=1 Tax=Prauserella muralis TaxID=588067 RepID=A0A2V4AHI0_9PSEU|nr:Chromate resistance protein ChrB [Prauserella muralis]PXY19374.1 chromate resistance protein [Prauserella muralis]TWE29336.1 hypothetical protein FHX69_2020 [Prauserella muralis]
MPPDGTAPRAPGDWVLLSYRVPREPSTPRIAVWRKLKRLGVAQLADGVVALPADARTREHLEWLADEILDLGGTAGIWVARPAAVSQERELASSMAAARATEYHAITEEAMAAAHLPENRRLSTARRLRAEMRRVNRRDYFPPPERERARRAIDGLRHPAAPDRAQETER